ncbi:hypothetical protein F4818DRAFT_172060 [Hypoxylon cercidicola]|nr:hypothetical protein F4818DRAFT_172060 [Hypoxylon cercidicola]
MVLGVSLKTLSIPALARAQMPQLLIRDIGKFGWRNGKKKKSDNGVKWHSILLHRSSYQATAAGQVLRRFSAKTKLFNQLKPGQGIVGRHLKRSSVSFRPFYIIPTLPLVHLAQVFL